MDSYNKTRESIEIVTDTDASYSVKILKNFKILENASRIKIYSLLKKDILTMHQKLRYYPIDVQVIPIFKSKLHLLIYKILGLIKAKFAYIKHNNKGNKYSKLIVISLNNWAIYSIPGIHQKTLLITKNKNKDINILRYNVVKYIDEWK